jgi:hypothetical protein
MSFNPIYPFDKLPHRRGGGGVARICVIGYRIYVVCNLYTWYVIDNPVNIYAARPRVFTVRPSFSTWSMEKSEIFMVHTAYNLTLYMKNEQRITRSLNGCAEGEALQLETK